MCKMLQKTHGNIRVIYNFSGVKTTIGTMNMQKIDHFSEKKIQVGHFN